MTDALDQVALPPSAYASKPAVKTRALAAVIWRYQRDKWTAGELRQVVEALGLVEPPQRKPLRRRVIREVVSRRGPEVVLSCGHVQRPPRPDRLTGNAMCRECST